MPPELAPVIELRPWYESHSLKHKDLARSLNISPQQLAELFSGRNAIYLKIKQLDREQRGIQSVSRLHGV
jgi:hypothetical protein